MTRDSTTAEEKSSRSYWGFVLWPVAVIVLYVLSVGPMALLADKHIISKGVLCIYDPLEHVIVNASLVRPYAAYIHLWAPELEDMHPGHHGPG